MNRPGPERVPVGSGLLAATAAEGLRDIRGPVPLTDPWVVAGWVAAALAGLGLAGAAVWWWRRRAARADGGSGPDPGDVARRRLAGALELLGDARAFVNAVSEAVREFLEARTGLRAPDRTTEEFLAELASEGRMDPGDRELLSDFLGRCDLVKFAGVRPPRPELEDLHLSALRLVDAPVRPTADAGMNGEDSA